MKYLKLSNILLFAVLVSFTSTYFVKKTFFLDEIISIRAAQNQSETVFVDSIENKWIDFNYLNGFIFKENHSIKEMAYDIYYNYISATDFPHTNLYHTFLRLFLGIFNFQGVQNYVYGMFLFQVIILFFLFGEIIKLFHLSIIFRDSAIIEIEKSEIIDKPKMIHQLLMGVLFSFFFSSNDVISNFLLNRQYWLTLLLSLVHFNFVLSNFEILCNISDFRKNMSVWFKFLFWSSILLISIYGAILWVLGILIILFFHEVFNFKPRIKVLAKSWFFWMIFLMLLFLIVFMMFPAYNLFNGRVNEAITNLFSFDRLYVKFYRLKSLLLFYGNPYILSVFPIFLYFFVRDVIIRRVLDLRYFLYCSAILFFLIVCFNLFVTPISKLRYAYPPLQMLYLLLIIILLRKVDKLLINKYLLFILLISVFTVNISKLLLVNSNLNDRENSRGKIEYTELEKLKKYRSIFGSFDPGIKVRVKVDLEYDFEIMHLMGMNFDNVEMLFTRGKSDKNIAHELLLTSFQVEEFNTEKYLYLGQVNCFHIYKTIKN